MGKDLTALACMFWSDDLINSRPFHVKHKFHQTFTHLHVRILCDHSSRCIHHIAALIWFSDAPVIWDKNYTQMDITEIIKQNWGTIDSMRVTCFGQFSWSCQVPLGGPPAWNLGLVQIKKAIMDLSTKHCTKPKAIFRLY